MLFSYFPDMYLVDNEGFVYSGKSKRHSLFFIGGECLAANPDTPIQQNGFRIVSLPDQQYYLFGRKLIDSYFKKGSVGVRLRSHEIYRRAVVTMKIMSSLSTKE